jgi:molecular chaperone GrpE
MPNCPPFLYGKEIAYLCAPNIKKTKRDMSRKKVTEEQKKASEAQDAVENKEEKKEEQVKEEAKVAAETEDQCKEAKEDAEDEKTLLKRQLEILNDKHLRLIAEYDNFRKRTLREKMELSKNAGESILLNVLPVIDDFDRARGHLGEASDLNAVKEGIDLIYNKFQEFLKQQVVSEIETEEQEFDSEVHEAVTKIPAPSEEMKGKIIDCIQKGYKLNDKVIRYPKVVVGE